MKKKYIVSIITVLLIATFFLTSTTEAKPDRGIEMLTLKTPTCGCCTIWTRYADKEGFDMNVKTLSESELTLQKKQFDIPRDLESCHTSIIQGYVVEGHIPIIAIDKLLAERPDIKGIALAGMPSGTPGMPGPKTEDWIIYALHNDGSRSIFMVI